MAASARVALTRDQILAFRAAVHELRGRRRGRPGILGVGIQDNPPGRSARLALALRGRRIPARSSALVHSVRGAMHLHHADDLGRYAAAVRPDDGTEVSVQSFGPFGPELAADGISLGKAIDDVAAAMSTVMADGVPRTKGELSGAVTPLVDQRIAPWCDGCGVHHVYDALFRYATLQAELAIGVESPTLFRFVRTTIDRGTDRDDSRVEIVRRYLRLAGPVQPVHLAAWLGLSPSGGRRWWTLVRDELVAVTVERRTCWVNARDLDDLRSSVEPPTVRLLGPYDPVTALGDRELLVPDRRRRRDVWKATGNPGVLLVRGDISGLWRQRTSGSRLTVTVQPFGKLTAPERRLVGEDARVVARHQGADDVDTRFE
ncbi:MAG TPA: crosslink repair DNA glycosylase YcaQ family protein [Jiangellaceae bacterium]|nr:crosslink repair DNA glycosylase YcaQ family protein [Jiangellaceae bacterium]